MNHVATQPSGRKYNREPALAYADKRLDAWSAWVKRHRDHLGLPRQSSIQRAIETSKVGVLFEQIEEMSKHTALGKETRTFHVRGVEIPEPLAEVDSVVARQPEPLRKVIAANYFTYGPIEVRAKESGYKLSRFTQLLESAKYAVWAGLQRSWDEESDF